MASPPFKDFLRPDYLGVFGLLEEPGGILLVANRRVIGGSPADTAGIEIGDIIVKVGDTELSESFLFLNALSRLAPDAVTTVEVLRPGGLQALPIELRPR